MGDINFADLCYSHPIERSQILAPSLGDNSLIENQMDPLTFWVNYTLMLKIILSLNSLRYRIWSQMVRKLNWAT